MNYLLAADVFFRKYGDKTIVYKTSKKQVAVMNATCHDILSFFRDLHDLSALISHLATEFGMNFSDKEKMGINAFLDDLIQKEYLVPEHTLVEQKMGLESILSHSDIIPKGTLQNAMFELTYRCNEKCRHCYCIGNDPKDELSTQKIKSLLDELYDMNAIEVTFTGGDLFMRKDTFEILDYAYEKNFLINIFTNGIALKEEDFYHLQRLHPKSISFSLYNYIPEKHDAFTQVAGSFEKTVAAARKCVALGIPVNIKTSVVAENMNDVGGILELVKSIGAYPQLSMAITPKNDGKMSPTELRINEVEKYKAVLRVAREHIEEKCVPDYANMAIFDRKICWAGETGLSINPFGEVFACNALLIKCGDVRTQTIKDIWEHSEELKRIRSFKMSMVKGCENCQWQQRCAFCVGSAMSEHGDPLMKYSEACNITQALQELNKEVESNV